MDGGDTVCGQDSRQVKWAEKFRKVVNDAYEISKNCKKPIESDRNQWDSWVSRAF